MKVHTEIDRRRRQLLKGLAALPAMSGVSLLAGTGTAVQAADCGASRSLVCIFLAGGADSFNMLVPGGSRYDEYRATRNELAVPEDELLEVDDARYGSLGFHALLPGFQRLYQRGDLAVIANAGTLTRPTDRQDYLGSVALPQALFAHNTQQKLWQTGAGIVNGSNAFGWGGAISSHAANCNGSINVAPAFSIAGSSDFLASTDTNYISLNADYAIERMYGYDSISDWIPVERLDRMDGTLMSLIDAAAREGNPYLLRGIAGAVGRATDATAALHTALRANTLDDMQFDGGNRLARQLHLVARLIAAREALGMKRQVFFVQMGGWDTHSDQLQRIPSLMTALNEAVESFQAAIDAMGHGESVTTFTASDFGRTLTSNGNGTDHGWGGNSFVFGGAVRGGSLYGDLPSFAATDNPDDAGEEDGSFAGRLIPQISVTQYASTLARWMGMDETGIADALPDLANFEQRDLGFLG